MLCPTLNELPPPPPDKTGWPWTEESPQLLGAMPDGKSWPKISIVTPSYNQGQYLEETIRSVLLQNYPNLEYIIIDGGSSDNSVEVIKKYEKWLSYWVSEPDRGQSHAINKGLKIVKGEIIGWLNSDDVYMRGAISTAVEYLLSDHQIAMIYGDCTQTDNASRKISYYKSENYNRNTLIKWWRKSNYIPQPTVFLRKSVFNEVGYLNEKLRFCMDYDLWLRIGEKHLKIFYVPRAIANYRITDTSKTGSQLPLFFHEFEEISKRHWGKITSLGYLYYWFSYLMSFRKAAGYLGLAQLEWSEKRYVQARKYLLKSFLNGPFIIFKRNYISMSLRNLIGDKNVIKLKDIFVKK